VDTLYDSRARLAVSAAAPPDKLYDGNENTVVFARTVSRLMEMQSREYREA
jgi:cell division protein ZapE